MRTLGKEPTLPLEAGRRPGDLLGSIASRSKDCTLGGAVQQASLLSISEPPPSGSLQARPLLLRSIDGLDLNDNTVTENPLFSGGLMSDLSKNQKAAPVIMHCIYKNSLVLRKATQGHW